MMAKEHLRFLVLFSILGAGFCLFGEGNIFDAMVKAKPRFPVIRVPDVIKKEEPSYTIESVLHTSNFNPTKGCNYNRTSLVPGDYGTITSPEYPYYYPSGILCEWLLEGIEGTKIEATVFDLHTQTYFFAYFDYIQFSPDGNFTVAERMAGDLNPKTPFIVRSNENKLGIRFRSSQLFNFKGFKIKYLVTSEYKEDDAIPTPFDGICGKSSPLFKDDRTTERPSLPGIFPDTPILMPGESKIRESSDSNEKSAQYWPDRIHIYGTKFTSLTENQKVSSEKADVKIVGGVSPEGAFPWQAALLIDKEGFCGGSLIDRHHIITAAHCTDGAQEIIVALGTNSLVKPSEARQLYRVTREGIFQHPNYNAYAMSNDISIIRLPERVPFTDKVSPICLPNRFFNSEIFQGEVVRMSGFGKASDSSESISPVMKNATIIVMPNHFCRDVFRTVVNGNIICTATKTTVSPCQGDTGGPLVIRQQTSRRKPYYMQIGIMSFGSNSCERALPVAFTRMTAYMDFVTSVTGHPY